MSGVAAPLQRQQEAGAPKMTKTMTVLVLLQELPSSILGCSECCWQKNRLRMPPPLGCDGSRGEGPSPHMHKHCIYHLVGEARGRLSESLPHIAQPSDCSENRPAHQLRANACTDGRNNTATHKGRREGKGKKQKEEKIKNVKVKSAPPPSSALRNVASLAVSVECCLIHG